MNQSITLKSLTSFLAAVLLAFPASVSAAEPKGNPANPDFTKGGAIPAGAKHDWNLGPTGLRGWMFCDQMVTTDARQISITQVEKGSPADGILAVGDVILGVGGKPFSTTRAPSSARRSPRRIGSGRRKLAVTRWRAGKAEEVVVNSRCSAATAPPRPTTARSPNAFSNRGARRWARKVAKSPHRDDPIVRSLNALALLASGDPAYLPLVKKEAQWAAGLLVPTRCRPGTTATS
jgi:hypothetical protein